MSEDYPRAKSRSTISLSQELQQFVFDRSSSASRVVVIMDSESYSMKYESLARLRLIYITYAHEEICSTFDFGAVAVSSDKVLTYRKIVANRLLLLPG